MAFYFYCSQARKKVKLETALGETVKIYSCGPTVYAFAHIGNFRTFLFNDILRRSLKAAGYKVHHAMNLTDIDDKTIAGAREKNPQAGLQELAELTSFYASAFFADLKKLRIEPVEENPHATHSITTMIELVETLLQKKHAYMLEGSVYFSIAQKKDYGKLSGINLEDTFAGARYDADEYEKDSLRDFALWKACAADDAIAWDASFGRGRPGWHLECSAMIESIFHSPIDIHTGGVDLIFPHHENEIAQSECAYNHAFVKHWLHCEHLLVDGKKMSKSLGNVYTLRDLEEKGFSPLPFRYFVLNAHYSQKINFTFDALAQAENALKKIENFWLRFMEAKQDEDLLATADLQKSALQKRSFFLNELEDNLNTPRALAHFFELMRETNSFLDTHDEKISSSGFALVQEVFLFMNSVLQILPESKTENEFSPDSLQQQNFMQAQKLLQEREQARKEKNYAQADALRKKINSLGFQIADSSEGSRLKEI